jgi:hypothetical protein
VEKWQFERFQTRLKHVALTRIVFREDAFAVTLHNSITTAQNHPPKSGPSSPDTPPRHTGRLRIVPHRPGIHSLIFAAALRIAALAFARFAASAAFRSGDRFLFGVAFFTAAIFVACRTTSRCASFF